MSRARRRARAAARRAGGSRAPLAAACLGFLLYAGTLSHGYVLDDDVITRRNAFVARGLEGIPDIFASSYLYGFNRSVDPAYRPIPLAATAAEVEFFGHRPAIHHLTNVLLYAVLCGVLVWTLGRIAGPAYPGLPLLAGLLFAAHPIHTEVVANVKGRDELWAALWGLVSLGCLWTGLPHRARSARWVIFALGAYLLAIFSKETAYAIFPIALALLFLLTRLPGRRVLLLAAGYAGATLFSLLVRWAVSRRPGIPASLDDPINNALLAAPGVSERLATNASILAEYARLLVFPRKLSFDYSLEAVPVATWADPAALLGVGLVAGSLAAMLLLLRGARRVEAASGGDPTVEVHPRPRVLAAAFLVFLGIALIPGSNLIFLTGATLAERFLFLPSVGFAVLLALGLDRAVHRVAPPAVRSRARWIVAGVILLLYGFKTVDRAAEWKSNDTLFQAALGTQPRSARVQHHAASRLREQGEAATDPAQRRAFLEQALAGYAKALEIYPRFAEATYNQGVTYAGLGRMDEAEAAYRRVLDLDPDHPDALNNFGVIAYQRGDLAGAEAAFSRAAEVNPWYPLTWLNLGAVSTARGNLDGAREVYAQGLVRCPEDLGLLRAMVELLTRQGDEARARMFRDRLAALEAR